jgi:PBSX family phage terminase large subunit
MIEQLSHRQTQVLTWWCSSSPWTQRDCIICDGAVRSGKTLCMSLSFVCWAMRAFHGRQLAFCGKSIGSVRRNLTEPLLPLLREFGFSYQEKRSENRIEISFGARQNTFYLFGGLDEGSASLIQGATFAGVLLDEVALMPRSFVEQACARCSVEGSRLWFNCNPEGPEHWFYKEWIQKAEEKNALYLHFTMEDNPSLSPKTLRRFQRLYTGSFYRRFVLGEWVVAQGLVYDFFDDSYVEEPPESCEEYVISCDYGTRNPASFGLWGRVGEKWYRVGEYYYDSRREGRQKTDAEYEEALRTLAGGRNIRLVVVDPSAASFITLLRQKGWRVKKAKNDVLAGIRLTASLLQAGTLVICSPCTDAIREFHQYRWEDGAGRDQVRKEFDHAMDDIRYFAATVVGKKETLALGASAPLRRRGSGGRKEW